MGVWNPPSQGEAKALAQRTVMSHRPPQASCLFRAEPAGERAWALRVRLTCMQTTASSLVICVALGKSCPCSELSFLMCKMGKITEPFPQGLCVHLLPWAWNVLPDLSLY